MPPKQQALRDVGSPSLPKLYVYDDLYQGHLKKHKLYYAASSSRTKTLKKDAT